MTADSTKTKEQLIAELKEARIRIAKYEQTQEALRTSESQLSLALETVNDAVWDWDIAADEIYLNPRWYQMLGYDPKTIPYKFDSWKELVHPDDKEEAENQAKSHLITGEPLQQELRLRSKANDWVWVYIRGKIVERNDDGTPARMLGTAVDITERKQMEEALRNSEEQFRILLNSVEMVAVQGYDTSHKVIYWNRASENLYGYSREEAMGRQLEDLIIPDYMREGVMAGVDNWYQNGEVIPAGELDLIRKDGSTVPVYSSHVMQINADGEQQMYCIDVDLSAQKAAYTDMVEAKDQAESANKAKSDFLANMSHEIRTPLNGMLGMLQLMQATQLKGDQKEFIDLAVLSSKRLTRLLTDILDLSRVEAGKLNIQSEPFDLHDTLNQSREIFQPIAMQSGITLNLITHAGTPDLVVGDPARLQQVLTNLLGNAFKFTNSGKITIEATPLSPTNEGRLRVLFSISDSGIGIPEDKLKNLFSPFTQANEGYNRRFQGAGLGLSICKHLVTLMGGSIAVESTEGQGTAIHFYTLFEEDTDQPAPDLIVKEDNAPFPSLKILLAEDDRVNRIAAVRQMERLGHTVTAVENGKLAVESLQADNYDIVILDIQMPIMDGLEATTAIRQGQAGDVNKNICILAMTAYSMAGDREEFLGSGMNGYLAKPVEISNMKRALETISQKECFTS